MAVPAMTIWMAGLVMTCCIARQSGCDERVNQDEIARLDFGMIVAIFGFCNA
jgi:hypothetical protein